MPRTAYPSATLLPVRYRTMPGQAAQTGAGTLGATAIACCSWYGTITV